MIFRRITRFFSLASNIAIRQTPDGGLGGATRGEEAETGSRGARPGRMCVVPEEAVRGVGMPHH